MKRIIFYILSGLLLFAGCTTTTEGYESNEVLCVSQDTFNVESSAVRVTIEVSSLVPYEIKTTEAWITPSKKSGEKGISEFRLDIAENKSFEGRTATVTVMNLMYGLSQDITILQEKAVPSNIIYYISSDGRVITPYDEYAFGANIVSNTYNNGQGAILFDEAVTSIGYCAFYQCANLASVTIPNQVTRIEAGAFFDCISLTSATIPDRVTEIGTGAFAGCISLASVAIGNSVTSIGEQAFIQCTSLTSITIPDGVTLIGNHAFYECSSLTSVYCKPTTPPSGGNEMFDYNASGRKIYVPTASVGVYKSASGWSSYADFIVGNDFESGAVDPETPETPENPDIPDSDGAWEITTNSVKAAVSDLATGSYGSQSVSAYSTFLTWGNFAACRLCLANADDYMAANCLQMQGNASTASKQGRIGNVSATPKRITKIVVESYNSAQNTPNFNLALDTKQVVGTSIPENMISAKTISTVSAVDGNLTRYVTTYEVTSGNYTYFAIYNNTAGALYFTKIRVEYAK